MITALPTQVGSGQIDSMQTDSRGWLPTGKGVADNVVAGVILTASGGLLAAALTWWADLGLDRLGTLIVSAGLVLTLALVWVLAAWGWRILYPAPKQDDALRRFAGGIAEALKPFRDKHGIKGDRETAAAPALTRKSEQDQPPFLVRLVGGWEFRRTEREPDDGGFDVVYFELVNAKPEHVSGIEVSITGETHDLSTIRRAWKKIDRYYLQNRRQVTHLNPGGVERYAVISRELHERPDGLPQTFWGDFKSVRPEDRVYAQEDAQHLIEILVTSSSTVPCTHRMSIIVTGTRFPHVIPIDPKMRGWIS